MDDLQTIINQLENDQYIDYVMARSETVRDAEAYRNAGIAKSVFYGWDKETRDRLNELARRLKVDTGLKAKLILAGATELAAEIKVKALQSRKENIQQAASTEILDRMLGKPKQAVDVTSGGEKLTDVIRIIKHGDDGDGA